MIENLIDRGRPRTLAITPPPALSARPTFAGVSADGGRPEAVGVPVGVLGGH